MTEESQEQSGATHGTRGRSKRVGGTLRPRSVTVGLLLGLGSVGFADDLSAETSATSASSTDAGAAADSSSPELVPPPEVALAPGQVLTFWGVRQLEQDANVPDDRKVAEWQAFLERSSEQVAYARKAVEFWKTASRRRVFESAGREDGDPERTPREKIEAWTEVARLFPGGREGRTASKRIVYWTHEETKRLVAEAEAIEKERRPKAERIAAWGRILRWTKKGSEARAAQKRINDLQRQIYREAVSADRIARMPAETKLLLWREVLRGRPSAAERRIAEQRVRALEGLSRKESPTEEDEP